MTNLRKISLTVFIVLCILCLAQGVYYYPLLPDKIASHFGVSGQPNGWSSKTSFISFYYIITAVMILMNSTDLGPQHAPYAEMHSL